MRTRQRFFTIFIIFFVLSLIVFFIFKTPVGNVIQGLVELVASPVQKITHISLIGIPAAEKDKQLKAIREENSKLLVQMAKQKEIEKENQALRDQFAMTTIPPKQLLPAIIIGSRSSNAGVVAPLEIVLDKGKNQGVIVGAAVIYKDILVGEVISVSDNRAVVRLPISKGSSIPAQTIGSNAVGIVKGQNEAMLFDNVVLSDSLKSKDIVVTKGSIDEKGRGYPPGLIIGKITAIHKKASALFQNAEIEPVLEINRLTTVFIHLGK
jgi:rod shape-determining protein MreC